MSILLFSLVILSIIGLFAYSLAMLIRDKRILIWPNLLQPILFCYLYYLIYIYLGSNYYKFDHEPALWAWIQFTLAHMLRATDILDVIEEFHIDIQNVKHAGNLVATTVMIMHWIMDIFLLGLLWRTAINLWENKYVQIFNDNRVLISLTVFLSLVALIIVVMQAQDKNKDLAWIILNFILLWPLDNIIRVIDVGDSFQLYGIRLHQLDMTLQTAIIATAFRFVISIPIARLINILHHGMGSGALKTVDELIDDLGDSEVADYAIDILTQSDRTSTPKLLCALGNSNVEKQKGVIKCLRRLDANVIKNAFNSLNSKAQLIVIDGLIKTLSDLDTIIQENTANTLGYLGIKAQAAIPALVQILGEIDLEVREAAVKALHRIDPTWTKHTALSSAMFELAKTLIIQNSFNKKIIPAIQSRIDDECKLIAQNLMQKIINAGVILSVNEAKYIKIGLNVGLAKKDAANRKSVIKFLENTNSDVGIIKLLAQTLTDIEAKKREKQKIIEAQLAATKQRDAQRKRIREQAQQWLSVLKPVFILWMVAMIILQIFQVLFGPRYQIHDDGTVTDARTGLMWKRCSEGQEWNNVTCTGDASTMSWDEAMPNEKQKSWPPFAGYSNWRIPAQEELRELCSCSRENQYQLFCNEYPQVSINETVFPNTPAYGLSIFWTSSLYEKNYRFRLFVAFRPQLGKGNMADRDRDMAFIRLV